MLPIFVICTLFTTSAGFGEFKPMPVNKSAYMTAPTLTCGQVKDMYKGFDCCGSPAKEVVFEQSSCFVEVGSHIAHAEGFNGVKVDAIATASECVRTTGQFDWQTDPRHPKGHFCLVGAFDGMNAKVIQGDGSQQTLSTGEAYMRVYINTEIRGRNDENDARWFVSTSKTSGGFGQPTPLESEVLLMHGALEEFIDYDRETMAAVNGGHAIKKVFTATGFPYQTVLAADATSEQAYAIVTEHKQLHVNIKVDEPERNSPICDSGAADYDPVYCGLYGHCGSKLCLKHEFSYETSSGVPAYGATSGVGFEDDVLFVAMEGGGTGGTVQVLDVSSGDFYQLPQLSMGTVEMAFSISTGNPDYIAVGIEDYGSKTCGSGWSVWIGKKDKSSTHFLDRNGLGINQGRIYRFVANNGETDMATFLNWPESGKPDFAFSDLAGTLEPIEIMFDGRFSDCSTVTDGKCTPVWTRDTVNCAKTLSGKTPVRMTGVSKQEWGAVNPDKPNQWAIAETGLGRTQIDGSDVGEVVPIGKYSSTVVFLEADFLTGLSAMDGSVTSRNGQSLPASMSAKVWHVMKDRVVLGPDRPSGLEYVDSLFWAKGGKVFYAEDSSASGGYNMAGVYDVSTAKAVPLAGAIGDTNRKMNNAAMVPVNSYTGAKDQELTGWFDVSAVLTVSPTHTPQEYYDALTGKHMIINNQMKGMGGCMKFGFYYTAQAMLVIVPDINFATTTLAAPESVSDTGFFATAYGKYRRRLSYTPIGQHPNCMESSSWETASETEFDHPGCQKH